METRNEARGVESGNEVRGVETGNEARGVESANKARKEGSLGAYAFSVSVVSTKSLINRLGKSSESAPLTA